MGAAMTITIGGVAYEAVVCDKCPGHAMISPPSALRAHLRHHNDKDASWNGRIIPNKGKGGRRKGPHKGKGMLGSGVEKKENIRAYGRKIM